MAQVWQKHGWSGRHVIGALIMLSLAVWACWPAWCDIVKTAWNSEENSHIFLVPVVSAWLVYVRIGRLRKIRPANQWWGLFLILVGAAFYLGGYSYDIYTYRYAGALGVAVGSLFTIFGGDIFLAFLPAVCVWIFVIPVPDIIRLPVAVKMQWYTAWVTQNLFDIMGFAVDQYQNRLEFNGREIQIAEACNGLRMIFALIMVSYAFAYGTPLRWYVRLLIIFFSPISAIVCNIIRLIPTVFMFAHFPGSWAQNVHDYLGWPMLPLSFLILLGIIRLLRWALLPVAKFTLAYD